MKDVTFPNGFGTTPRVLIVDDMMVNRTILASMLASHGISSDLAESGQECIDLCRENTYDLILMDHRMPDMDGVDTLLVLKEMFKETGHEVPVICHTTEEGKSYINLYKAAGFADVLLKPIDPGELAVLLMKYLPDPGGDEQEAKAENEEQSQHTKTEIGVLPSWIRDIPGLNTASGLERCGTAEDYISALKIFYASIGEKAGEIEKYLAEENWDMYSARIRALKNLAGLIGAEEITDRATDLEDAVKNEEYKLLPPRTSELLTLYRCMLSSLKPVLDLEGPGQKENHKATMYGGAFGHPILYIGDEKGIVSKGIIKCLNEIGFKVITIRDELQEINLHRPDADMMLYYPTGDVVHIKHISAQLAEISRDDNKTLCFAGEPLDISSALKIHDSNFVSAVYPRPVDHEKLTEDMKRFAARQIEYSRVKNVLIIDDDKDFLKITTGWLEQDYDIDCASSDRDAMHYLEYTVPDLIVLSDELHGNSGLEIMQHTRDNPRTKGIPIIILSEKNDRENVMRILKHKPDGYLLKSMPKESLLESIDRFFAGSILKDH